MGVDIDYGTAPIPRRATLVSVEYGVFSRTAAAVRLERKQRIRRIVGLSLLAALFLSPWLLYHGVRLMLLHEQMKQAGHLVASRDDVRASAVVDAVVGGFVDSDAIIKLQLTAAEFQTLFARISSTTKRSPPGDIAYGPRWRSPSDKICFSQDYDGQGRSYVFSRSTGVVYIYYW